MFYKLGNYKQLTGGVTQHQTSTSKLFPPWKQKCLHWNVIIKGNKCIQTSF